MRRGSVRYATRQHRVSKVPQHASRASGTHRDDGGEGHAKLKALLRSPLIVFASLQRAREIQRRLGTILNDKTGPEIIGIEET
jgi:hypothetical protein